MRFRDFISIRKFLAPRWLTEGEGEQVGFSLGAIENGIVEATRLGIMARLPQNDPTGLTTAPDDALQAMGRDRKILRGFNESSASYAARLIQWLDDHRARGTAFMMLKQLAGYLGAGFSFRIYDNRGNCYSRSEAGAETFDPLTGWDWDGDAEKWARFWVVVYPSGDWVESANQYADPGLVYGPNLAQWGVEIPREQIRAMQAIVADWKPEGTRCIHIIVAFDPMSFDPAAPEPDGTWGKWGKVVAGVRVPARLDTARYLNGSFA